MVQIHNLISKLILISLLITTSAHAEWNVWQTLKTSRVAQLCIAATCVLGISALVWWYRARAQSRLFRAVQEGDINTVKGYLDAGYSVETSTAAGTTLLMLACINGRAVLVQQLVENYSADVNAKDPRSWRPLMYVAMYPDPEVAYTITNYLISQGAAIKGRDAVDFIGQLPIHFAANFDKFKMVRLFLERGVYINQQDNLGRTPLILAAAAGHKIVVNYLIRGRNPDRTLTDHQGYTAHWHAQKNGHLAIAQLLQ